MKKIITPSSKEECIYYSDFTGKAFGFSGPEVTLTMEFNYGSKHDGTKISFDLSDQDCSELLDLIKHKLSSEARQKILPILHEQ